MGQSTDGQIFFGVLLEEGAEFPWDGDPFGGDIDDWWIMKVKKWNPPFELYDESGEFLPGMETDENIDVYYESKYKFKSENPLPVELVNVCSAEYPIYGLAVLGTYMFASRGYPESFNPLDLTFTKENLDKLLNFLDETGIESDSEPQWYLSSYWG